MNAIAKLRIRLWVTAYCLEEARQSHATSRRYLRSAVCCIGLALLRAMRRKA